MAYIYTISDMQELARLYRGKCLSKEYINTSTPLTWMCAKGHTWDADYEVIRQGSWCRQCIKQTSLEEIKKIALSKGGKCLSDTYNGKHLLIQCGKGHTWETTAHTIRSGHWCMKCSGAEKLTIDVFQKLAESKGGKLLSLKYVNAFTPLKFQCDKGHIWFSKPYSVRNLNTWCPQCSKVIGPNKQRDSIELFIDIAEKHGGKLLSKKYVNSKTRLKWQCKEGHQWLAIPTSVKLGKWCRKCVGTQKLTIQEMQEIAKQRGGICLSKKYIDSQTKLTWQCKNGHTWNAVPGMVKLRSWCPYCAGKKNNIKELNGIAMLKGGKLLSKKYISARVPHKWQCAAGHIWMATPDNIKNRKSWCPVCRTIKAE